MKKGLNFRTIESQEEYFKTYDKSLNLMNVEVVEKYVTTTYGDSHVICCGDHKKPPFVLLYAASCGSPIWYRNMEAWSQHFCIYAIDLVGEASKSILTCKMSTPKDIAKWLDETIDGLGLNRFYFMWLIDWWLECHKLYKLLSRESFKTSFVKPCPNLC